MSSSLEWIRVVVRTAWYLTQQTTKEFLAVNGIFLAAGLSFYVLLYCFPLLLLFVTAMGYTVLGSERALDEVQALAQELVPSSEYAVMQTLSEVVQHRSLLGAFAVATFLLFGTFLFGAVRHVLNVVFGVDRRRTLLGAFRADLVTMLGTGGLLAVTLGIAVFLTLLVDFLARLPILGTFIRPDWAWIAWGLGVFFTWAVLYLLYRIAPGKTIGTRGLLAASICGTALLEISKWLFGSYAESARDYAVLYGALASFIFFMLWIYYASSVFILAAAFGRIADRMGKS